MHIYRYAYLKRHHAIETCGNEGIFQKIIMGYLEVSEPPVITGWESGWSPESVFTLWSREKSFSPAESQTPIMQSTAIPTELSWIPEFSSFHRQTNVAHIKS
jgi:hypothetical protein